MSSEGKFQDFIKIVVLRAEVLRKVASYLGPETRILIAALYTLLREKK